MNLRIFFDSLQSHCASEEYEPNSLAHFIQIHSDNFPDWQNASIAIIGIEECRGTLNSGIENAPEQIRRKLYHLQKGAINKKIVDLGNLRNGVNLQDSYQRLKEVCEILHDHHVFPLILGGGHDMDFGQFSGYNSSEKLINLIIVDATLDMRGTQEFGENRHHLHKILVEEPTILFHLAHLGYQSFLNDPQCLTILEKLHFEAYRVGHVREKMAEMEPVIRNGDMLSFDISAIKKADAPGNVYAQPFGLTGEEACQLCWYAGLSQRLTSAGFYEYNPLLDLHGQTASVIATMIWYFLEGYALRKNRTKIPDHDFTKYIVAMPEEPHKLVFFKDNYTEKWWIEVPSVESKPQYSNVNLLPCSYSDYLSANQGEIPTRWIITQAKMEP